MKRLAFVILAACPHRAQPPATTTLGESTAPGPRLSLAGVAPDAAEAASGPLSTPAIAPPPAAARATAPAAAPAPTAAPAPAPAPAPVPAPAPAPAEPAQPGVTSPPPTNP